MTTPSATTLPGNALPLSAGREPTAPAIARQFSAAAVATASADPSAPKTATPEEVAVPLSVESLAADPAVAASPSLNGAATVRPAYAQLRQAPDGIAVPLRQATQPLGPVPAEASKAATVAVPTAQVPISSAQGDAAPVTIQAQAVYTPIQPVMSALHRAAIAPAEAKAAEPISMTQVFGEAPRRDPGTLSDASSNRESGGAALSGDGTQAAPAPVDASPGGRQFADIIQGLPPIAQSRIGGVADSAPVATGAADVGANLQGQAIDMTVGGQWIDRMAKEITALASGTGHSRFQLSPPNLGRIQIDVWQGEGGGKVQLLTETDEAARQLRDGQASLQSDPRLAALQLGTITIDRAPSGFDNPRDQQNPQQNSRQSQQGNDQGSQNAQSGTQANTQGGSQQNSQQNAQAALQSGMQGGNSGGQGKSSARRDVLNHQADIVSQQGGTLGGAGGRDGDRLVRYA